MEFGVDRDKGEAERAAGQHDEKYLRQPVGRSEGILEAMNARWDGLRMIKQVGRNAGADTFPGGEY